MAGIKVAKQFFGMGQKYGRHVEITRRQIMTKSE